MKYFKVYIVLSLFFCLKGFGQENVIKRFYEIPQKISYCDTVIHLTHSKRIKFNDLDSIDKRKIKDKYFNSKVSKTFTNMTDIDENKISVTQPVKVDSVFWNNLVITKPVKAEGILNFSKGYVLFEDDKLKVNPYLTRDDNGELNRETYYFKLVNRRSIELKFSEWTISALTIPIKYRFQTKKGSVSIKEEFSADFNANLFIGRSFYGKSKFLYRKDVGNITYTSKLTYGLLFGISTVELKKANTLSERDDETTKGLLSSGLGLSYSYNKINVGLFGGVDFGVGRDINDWNYDGQPWLGFAVGYSILNF